MRQRRRRTAFTDEQLDRLEDSFEKERFPGIQIREDLARELNIGEDRIQVKVDFFCNFILRLLVVSLHCSLVDSLHFIADKFLYLTSISTPLV